MCSCVWFMCTAMGSVKMFLRRHNVDNTWHVDLSLNSLNTSEEKPQDKLWSLDIITKDGTLWQTNIQTGYRTRKPSHFTTVISSVQFTTTLFLVSSRTCWATSKLSVKYIYYYLKLIKIINFNFFEPRIKFFICWIFSVITKKCY